MRDIKPKMIALIDKRLKGNGLAEKAINDKDARTLFLLAAECLVGIREKGGNNRGFEVELIQSTIGTAVREAWCMSLIQTCLAYVEKKLGVKSPVYASEHCMTVWNKTKKSQRVKIHPLPGAIIIWQKGKSASGHTGVVRAADEKFMLTVEGNTESGTVGGKVVRDGGGVYAVKRNKNGTGNMKVVGFLKPF